MGGSKITTEKVKGDLEQQLVNNARQLLQTKFNTQNGSNDLQTVLHDLAVRWFKEKYNFDFSDTAANVRPDNPPIATKIGSSDPVKAPTTVNKPCSFNNLDSDLSGYIKSGILAGLDLPEWLVQNVVGDLGTIAKTLLKNDADNNWRLSEHNHMYDPAAGDKYENGIQVKSVMVYVNAELTEGDINTKSCILYYVAVYYPAQSATMVARQDLEKYAYNKAIDLKSNTPNPIDQRTLRDALKPYAAALFKKSFGYEYQDKYQPDKMPPDMAKIVPDASQPNCGNNETLFYRPDFATADEGALQNTIDLEFFQGISLNKAIRVQGIADMMKQVQHTQSSKSGDSWIDTKIDQIYYSGDDSIRPMKIQMIMLHLYKETFTTPNAPAVQALYVYCMAVLYDLDDHTVALRQKVVNDLCKDLQPKEGEKTFTFSNLQDLVQARAKEYFKAQHNFEFGATAPDQVGKARRWQFLFHAKELDEKKIQEQARLNLFDPNNKNSDKLIPDGLREQYFNNIVARIKAASDPEDNHLNQWVRTAATVELNDYTEWYVIYHAIGEAISSGQAPGSNPVKEPYVYFLACFCNTKASAA